MRKNFRAVKAALFLLQKLKRFKGKFSGLKILGIKYQKNNKGGFSSKLAALKLIFEVMQEKIQHLLIFAARTPAPKPLSILTTETPAAQLFSIAKSAAMPLNAAP